MIDSQMDDMIKENLALKQQIDSLEQNLSNQIKEKESLLQTFTVFKNKSKEKESKYIDKEIDLEKKIKELDNIVYKKAQRIKPTLYDGSVISSQHAASPVINNEETLILEEILVNVLFHNKNCLMNKLSGYKLHTLILTNLLRYLSKLRLLRNFLRCYDICYDSTTFFDDVNVEMQSGESCVKCLDLDAELLNKQNAYNDLSKSYSQLEKHCISLELTMQLNQEIFQKDSFSNNQNALEILEYFENNDWKAQLQAKDTKICKLKEHIKSMRENDTKEKVRHEMDEIETINIELEHSVAKLLSENEHLHKEIEHLKKIYKDQFDSIKKTRALSKEHDDSLIVQLNSKSMENADLKRQIQDKDLLVYVRDTFPNAYKPSEKLIAVTTMNKVKKVRFSEPLTSSSNIQQVELSKTPDSNTPVLLSTGLKCSTSTCRSQPLGNKKNDRISQTPSSNMKNKVELQRRRVKLSSNKKNRIKDPLCDANVKHTMLNANSELICLKCNQCMFDANHDVCFLDFVNDVNV
ncbi:hypothetical protein Tco_0699916 [Tanacetum coccineum]